MCLLTLFFWEIWRRLENEFEMQKDSKLVSHCCLLSVWVFLHGSGECLLKLKFILNEDALHEYVESLRTWDQFDQFEVSPRVNSIIIFLRYFRLCPTFIKLISTIGDLIFFYNSIVLDRLFRISFGFHFIYYLCIIISFNGIRAYLRRFGLRRIKLWKETWCQTLVK